MQQKRPIRHSTTFILTALSFIALSCKHAGNTSDPKVIGGTKATEPYGFFVALRTTTGDGIICGGARISRTFVVTAAHCANDLGLSDRLIAAIGPTEKVAAKSGKQYRVKQVIVHPDFDLDKLNDDIALLELAEDPDLDKSKDYVNLAAENQSIKEGQQLTVIGFGRQTTHGQLDDTASEYLQEARMPVIKQDVCASQNNKAHADIGIPSHLMAPVLPTNLCVGVLPQGKVDSCNGDSGGPLVRKTDDGAFQLIGIVSRGMPGSCASAGSAGIYTRIPAYRDWIEGVLIDAADPLSKDNLVSRSQYACYTALNPLVKSENIQVRYGFDKSQSSPWNEDDNVRWKSGQPEFTCSETLESSVELRLFPGKDPFDRPFALVAGPGDLYTKVFYKMQSVSAATETDFIEYFPESKNLFGFIQGSPVFGQKVSSPPTRDDSKAEEFSRGPFASKIWFVGEKLRYAEIRYGNNPVQYFQLFSVKKDRDPEVSFDKNQKKLTINNVSSYQVVSWNLTCRRCFSVKDQEGVIHKGETFTANGTEFCGISARYPRHPLAVIPPSRSLILDIGDFDGNMSDCLWNQRPISVK